MKQTKYRIPGLVPALMALCLILPFQAAGKETSQQEQLESAKTAITTISSSEAEAIYRTGEMLFLDVREPSEFNQGHIPGAVNIPMKLVEQQISQNASDKESRILIYCRSGRRSALVTADLIKMGYTHLMNLGGGINEWTKAGYPVE